MGLFRRLCPFVVILAPVWSMGHTGVVVSGQAMRPTRSAEGVWQFVSERPAGALPRADLFGPSAMALFSKRSFEALVDGAGSAAHSGFVMVLPMPDGTFARFLASESQVLAEPLAAAFPEIRTYAGVGLDDPTASTRFGWTQDGFHAIVLSASGSSYVDPYEPGNADHHVVFRKQDHRHDWETMRCLGTMGLRTTRRETPRSENVFPLSHGTALRTYRLAVAATGEYTAAAGGTIDGALSRMTATINRVNAVYERDLSVRMTLLTGPASDVTGLIYVNGSTDPYTNTNGVVMLSQNQTNLDAVMGPSGYDIGHVFSTGGGGVASLGSVCTSSKARGVTGSASPTGDAFDIDYVAHEIGHQFGANHTFNGTSSSCGGGNRSGAHAYEVGSGSTIQAYAGICGAENLQRSSHDYFHVESLDEMTAFLTTGSGSQCGTTSPTGNGVPVVSTAVGFTVPRQTPFALTASAFDPDGDPLTYTWEQFDLGVSTSDVASASTDRGSGPLFRSHAPSTSPTRYFPSLPYILNHANAPPATYACAGETCLTGETLPDTERTMRFQVTVRDNRPGGGAIATAHTDITVSAAAGPFVVTAPNAPTLVTAGAVMTVTWTPNGTQLAPVNATHVEIALSVDGGQTFPTILAASAPNDGLANVTIPRTSSSAGRIRVRGVGHVFFDVSDTNFTIAAGPPAGTCPTLLPATDWICVNGGWVPPDHPLASTGGTPPPSPCVGGAPMPGWLCINGGWVPPNHPIATGARRRR